MNSGIHHPTDCDDRLKEFLRGLVDHAAFSEIEMVTPTTRGFSGETSLKIAVVQQDEALVRALLAVGSDRKSIKLRNPARCTDRQEQSSEQTVAVWST